MHHYLLHGEMLGQPYNVIDDSEPPIDCCPIILNIAEVVESGTESKQKRRGFNLHGLADR